MTWKQEYFHACDVLRANGWNISRELVEDTEVWYDTNHDATHIIMCTVYIHGITMRVDFYEENGIVMVYTCHKCNDCGCVFTEQEYESMFLL